MSLRIASTTIRMIHLRPRFLAYWSNLSIKSASRNFHFPHSNPSSIHLSLPHPPPRSLSAMTTPQPSSDSKTERVVIKGRVQGVWYRNWTVDNATELGLKGWVRNRKDGSVEALFSGKPDAVKEMEQRCRRGPPDAVVTGLEVFPSDDDPGTGFQRKQTV
ncbi:uncharacterized protein LOC130720640 [Lotus japonicus]|uniref:uncharacterized protein LOC130720640 n=1 Tax=Lotus japonicus TaxID=34305 RepID=UPI00258B51DC|nr:uncharacterized protein LOC130720640 [Lotus japonicus]XP_057427295.1 uncharacterized protein LOC130720640 [Lotus japonicus]